MDLDELVRIAEGFETWAVLKPRDKVSFASSSREDVIQELGVIQAQRDMTKTMMDMTRIQPFLTGIHHLEKVLNALGFQHTAKVMSYVWGPVRYLVKVR